MKTYIYIFLAIVLVSSCKEDDSPAGSNCIDGYDQTALLLDIRDHMIVPGYSQLNDKIKDLQSSISTLATNPTVENLAEAQEDFKQAYAKYVSVAHFDLGPAETIGFNEIMNSFPTDESKIDANIANGDYDLDAYQSYDKGFPALDYILFKKLDVDESLMTDENFNGYLQDVIIQMVESTDKVVNEWNKYGDEFVNNIGTNAGSSLSLIINGYNKYFEITKRDRIGIPVGALTLDFTNPEKVEAYHSGISKELVEASLQSSSNLFNGFNNVKGLRDLLEYKNAEINGESLSKNISDQYVNIFDQLGKIDGELSDAVDNDSEDVKELYKNLAQLVLQNKTDMPSVLCISITYVENPSDSD